MGGQFAPPDPDPFAFDVQAALSHCSTTMPKSPASSMR
jgi:hypothetical protein